MDLEIREFSNGIIKYINETPLPIEVKRLVLRDICTKLDVAADGEIVKQIAERDRKEKEREEKEKTNITEEDIQGIMKSAEMANGIMQDQIEREEQEKQLVEKIFASMDGGNGDE